MRCVLTAFFLAAAAPAAAQPSASNSPSPSPSPVVTAADARELVKSLEQEGKIYGDARRALSSGRPDETLRILRLHDATSLLADREALLRGDALLALGQKPA